MRPPPRLLLVIGSIVLTFTACSEPTPTGPTTASTPAAQKPAIPVPAPSFDLGGSSSLNISTTVLDFGEAQVGTVSASQTVAVTNLGIGPVVMSGAGGNPGGAFTGSQNCQGVTLIGGASCQMTFAFVPAADGPASAVASGTWNGQPFAITLRGVGVGPRLLVSPSGLDLGEVPVNGASHPDTVTVTNIGKGPLTMSGAGGNPGGQFTGSQSCQGLTLPVGGKCYLIYSFLPTAAGPDSAVSAGTWNGLPFYVRLRGTGVGPRFSYSSVGLDFGEVAVGTVSRPDSVRVTNVSSVPVTMSGAGGNPGGQFTGSQSCQGLTLPVGGSCYLIYTFIPSASGPDSAVSAGTWNGIPFHIRLNGYGLATGSTPSAQLLMSPTAFDFGDVQVGTTSRADTVTITNVSSGPIQMNGAGGNPGGQFTGAQSCQGLTLQVGAKCYLIYNFVPTSAGPDSAVSAGIWNGQPFYIRLRGNGRLPSLRLDPTGLEFGDVQVGTTSRADSVTVTNVGTVPVTMNGAGGNPGGSFTGAQSCQGLTLQVGAKCYLIYNFVPTSAGPDSAVSAGTWNGVPFYVRLNGNAVAPKLLITPAGFDFGRVEVGSTSMPDTAVVTNVGVAPLTMNGAGGNPGGEFAGAQSCQGLQLAVGAACRMIYTFAPAAQGQASATSSGSWNGLSFNIPLVGVGFAQVLHETMKITPGAIHLAHLPVVTAALLSTPDFDATAVSVASVRMLVNGTVDVAPAQSGGVPVTSIRDANGDGVPDLVVTFNTSDLASAGLDAGATSGSLVLHGTLNGQYWVATDPTPPRVTP